MFTIYTSRKMIEKPSVYTVYLHLLICHCKTVRVFLFICASNSTLYVVGYMFYMIRTNAKLKIPNIDIFAEEQEQIDIYKSQLYITWLN